MLEEMVGLPEISGKDSFKPIVYSLVLASMLTAGLGLVREIGGYFFNDTNQNKVQVDYSRD